MGTIKMWECKEYGRNRSKIMQTMCERKKERKRGWKRKREYDACMELHSV